MYDFSLLIGTYWSAAKYLATYKIEMKIKELEEKEKEKLAGKKRPSSESATGSTGNTTSSATAGSSATTTANKKSKSEYDAELIAIHNVPDVPSDAPVYHNCDEIRRMINQYLMSPGVMKTRWLDSMGIQSKSFNSFMKLSG